MYIHLADVLFNLFVRFSGVSVLLCSLILDRPTKDHIAPNIVFTCTRK